MNLLPFSIVYLHEGRLLTAKILKGAHPAAIDGPGGMSVRGGRPTVVIADFGSEAEVLVFPPGEAVERGVQFRYRGTTWIITGTRRDSGLFVAEPFTH